MTRYFGILFVLSLLLFSGNSTPLKRLNRNPDTVKVEEKVEEETISEERNETLFTELERLNDFYTDKLPAIKLTISPSCDGNNTDRKNPDITVASSVDCLSLDATACAENLKKQFIEKVKGEYVRQLKIAINQILDIYTTVSKELPDNDPHQEELKKFIDLIRTDLPKLTTAIDLETLDNMYKALPDDLQPDYSNTSINGASKRLYDFLIGKHDAEKPSMGDLNKERLSYVNKIWYELIEDLRGVQLLKMLSAK